MPIELMIIADDYTGALDTAVQFAKRGIASAAFTAEGFGMGADVPAMAGDIRLLSISTDSRHLPAAGAYNCVHRVVEWALDRGIGNIYKKTDSALRGNIGAELLALLDAAGEQEAQLHFLPAFPKNGRVTVGGVHYLEGIPVSETVFGIDPFTPVLHSNIADLIAEQCKIPARIIPAGKAGTALADAGDDG